jgi:hypothetical protein
MNWVPTCTKHVYPADNDDEAGHQLADCEDVLDTHEQLHTHEVYVRQQPWDMQTLLTGYKAVPKRPDGGTSRLGLLGFWAPHIVRYSAVA